MKQCSPSDNSAKRRPGWFARTALERALAKGGCLLCQALRASARRDLFSFLYEGMMSGDVRQKFLQGGGFCRLHFWQAKAIEDECWPEGFGVSILCDNLVSLSLRNLEAWQAPRRASRVGLRRFGHQERNGGAILNPGAGCIACATLRDREEHYLGSLQQLLEEADFSQRYCRSQGLCLPHLEIALRSWESSVALERINKTAQSVMRQLLHDLQEFQRKHDYRYKDEPRGSEWTSPRRTIEFLVGPVADLTDFQELQPTRKTRHNAKG